MNKEVTITYGDRTIARRPNLTDDFVLNDTFDALLPELAIYFNWDEGYQDTEKNFIECLRKSFIKTGYGDGYEIVRALEQDYLVTGSADLVEVFDNAPFFKHLKEHIRLWVNYFKIEPLFRVGSKVSFRHGNRTLIGIIVEANYRYGAGEYLISVEGEHSKPVVPWEACTLLEAPLLLPAITTPNLPARIM